MGLGSYARFALGLILSIEIVRSWLVDRQVTPLAVALSAIFIILAILFFVKRV